MDAQTEIRIVISSTDAGSRYGRLAKPYPVGTFTRLCENDGIYRNGFKYALTLFFRNSRCNYFVVFIDGKQ